MNVENEVKRGSFGVTQGSIDVITEDVKVELSPTDDAKTAFGRR